MIFDRLMRLERGARVAPCPEVRRSRGFPRGMALAARSVREVDAGLDPYHARIISLRALATNLVSTGRKSLRKELI